jgi:hypothetical protein
VQPSSLPPPPDSPAQPLLFNDLGPRRVEADFSAGHLSSDGGLLLLRQIDEGLGISRTLASCFHDHRDPRFTEHSLRELLAQRLLGVAAVTRISTITIGCASIRSLPSAPERRILWA